MPRKYKRKTRTLSKGGQVIKTKSGSKITMGPSTITSYEPVRPTEQVLRKTYKIPKTPKTSGIGWGP